MTSPIEGPRMEAAAVSDEVFVLPMSFAQERLWFLDQLDPGSSAYNLAAAVRLRGTLDVGVARRSLAEIVSRHESLRTTFAVVDDVPSQLISAAGNVDLSVIDWSGLPEDVRQRELGSLTEREARRAFELSTGPLLRTSLVRLAPDEHLLLWVVHHSVFDGWSTRLVLGEFTRLYSALARGRTSPLAALGLQYADFADWQRKRAAAGLFDTQLDFWRQKLAELPALLELPTDRPRTAAQRHRGRRHLFRTSKELAAEVQGFARRSGTTLYAVLMASFQALLGRYANAVDIAVGSPVTNRSRVELEGVVGCFANTVVVRGDLRGDPSFLTLVQRVAQAIREAQAHQDVPFERVVESLRPERNLSYSPLCQVLFALQPELPPREPESGLELELLDLDLGGAQFDLSLEIAVEDACFACSLEYDTDLFEQTTIERFAERFVRVLEASVARSRDRLSQLPWLADEERATLLRGARGGAGPEAPGLVHELFRQRALEQPAAVAVIDGAGSCTYAELAARANRLAHALVRAGVVPDTRIGVCSSRSSDMLVAVLGILGAGGAYVPLDPTYPKQRLRELVEAAGLRLVVTDAEAGERLPEHVARLMPSPLQGGDEEAAPPRVTLHPENAAYVIFTSGSTGTPKGVVVPHRALSRFVDTSRRHYELSSRDRVLQFASLSFDASVEEIFPCLTSGATLVLRSEVMLESIERFLAACQAWGITVLDLPTMYFQRWAAEVGVHPRAPESLRLVIIGGEAALPEPVRAWLRAHGERTRLVNTYGPTEATVVATSAELSEAALRDGGVPIGKPLDGAEAYVLDAFGALVPEGVEGELYLGGEGLARGYLGSARATAERFVPHPVSDAPGARLYRTGDRVRARASGQLEFRGRVDHQVKLRGFRIELGELEARLLECPHVKEAAVLLREDAPGEQRLVAYVSGTGDLSQDDLRSALARSVPDFMVPAAFVVLSELPRTVQGKVDRRALEAPELPVRLDVAPRSTEEARLSEIFAALLRRTSVSIFDNFFELGGDSILALQVVARARSAGIVLAPRDLFRHQTVAELARASSAARPALGSEAPALGEVPLTPMQRWFSAHRGERPDHFNQSFGLVLRAGARWDALQAAVRAVVQRHDAFRLRFSLHDDALVQRLDEQPAALLDSVDLSAAPDPERALLAVGERFQRALQLEEGPLFAVVWIEMGPERPARVLLIAHHLVVDAVSWRILLEEIELAYQQTVDGNVMTWSEVPLPFSTAARCLEALPSSSEPSPISDVASVPCDHAEGSQLEGDTVRLVQSLSEQETAALLEAARRRNVRPDDVLLAAFALVIGELAGGARVAIDVEHHGRDVAPELDLSRTVGWFTRLQTFHLEGSPERFGEVLAAVAAQRASGCAAGSAPVSFNFLGQWDELLAPGGLFAALLDDVGQERDPSARRAYELELDSALREGTLKWIWSYSSARFERQTLERLGRRFSALVCAFAGSPQRARSLPALGDVEDAFALSPLQKGLLFHSLWARGSGVYVEQVSCRLEGELDVEAFRDAWQSAIEHHGLLRTTFHTDVADEPLQAVQSRSELVLERLELSALSPAERESAIADHLERDRARGFDLHRGPLSRLALLRESPTRTVMVWSHHHLILDGWSAALVLRDVWSLYGAARAGEKAALPPARPYRDYIDWLAARPASPAFWEKELATFDSPTPLPFDRSRKTGEVRYGTRTLVLDRTASRRLEELVQNQHLTSSTLLQAAWALVLARTSRTSDVLFGITTSGRSAELLGIEGMVGLFINTLPRRVSVSASLPVRVWLARLQEEAVELMTHEHGSLSDARARSAVPAGRALFETLLVFENYPADPRLIEGVPGLAVRDVAYTDQTNYPLTLTVIPGQALTLRLSYDVSRIEDQDAARLLELVRGALHGFSVQTDARVGDILLQRPSETEQLVRAWNTTERAYPSQPLVHELFEQQAALRPNATAVVFENRRLSYAELDKRANQLAHALRRRGVGPDVLVAIVAERSLELVVGLLAILKAGGAYVPIDPEYPAERVAYMLGDAGARVLLSSWALASALPVQGATLLCFDADRAEIEREPTTKPEARLLGAHLAYTIYTSGSTGQPKGAGNTHAGLLNRLLWMQEHFALAPSDRVLQKTPFSFDVSVWEFFWPLMVGAVLVVARPGDHRDGERIAALIEEHGVTTTHFVPSMLQAFLETPDLRGLGSLRRVICSGEALSRELVRRFFERIDAELHNLYGPTEASIDVTAWQCRADEVEDLVPIGRPIANTQMYILDAEGHPTPLGVAGELFIAGVGLARGYHQRPALTAERFVPDPFSRTPSARMYRTGDLARFRLDGAIEFLGRLDHQIKIRGLRVELGEIEARLQKHLAVREAVVVARDEKHGGKRLVAYVTLREPSAVDAKGLSAWVAASLPAYMVPTAVVILPALPLSANGKLDRRALPAQEVDLPARDYVAPRDEREALLTEIWAMALHQPRVGIDDDFFELGGDSIVSLQVIARAAQRGLRLDPKLLFENPTIRALATLASAVSAPDGAAEEPAAGVEPNTPNNQTGVELSDDEWRALLEEVNG